MQNYVRSKAHSDSSSLTSLTESLLDVVLTYAIVIIFVVASYPLLNEQLLLTVP